MKTSKGEQKIINILKKEKIAFVREQSFSGLKYKGHFLRFDFAAAINEEKILIEWDGENHFENVKFFNKDNWKHKLENDRRKNKFALLNGYTLYRIPYWEYDYIHTLADIMAPRHKVKSIYHNDRLLPPK